MQNQSNAKNCINSEDILKSTKNVLEKINPKQDSSKTTISKVLRKKFLTERKLQSNNTTFA